MSTVDEHPHAYLLGREVGMPQGGPALCTSLHTDGTATLTRGGAIVAVVRADGVLINYGDEHCQRYAECNRPNGHRGFCDVSAPSHEVSPISYDEACRQAATAQGLDPVTAALRTVNVGYEVEQTGGFCMVVTVRLRSGAYIGVTLDEAADSVERFVAYLYPSAEVCEGDLICGSTNLGEVVRAIVGRLCLVERTEVGYRDRAQCQLCEASFSESPSSLNETVAAHLRTAHGITF